MLNKFFRYAFARSGDKAAVPDAVVPGGDVSYDQGYGPDYQLPPANPTSKDIERDKMNQVFNDITLALQEYQTNGTPDWITNAQNGGVAFPYPEGARVRYTDGFIYVSRKAANVSLPTVAADWFQESGRLLAVRVFTASGTYTPTAGTKAVRLTLQGGGGAGGGAPATGAAAVGLGTGAGAGATVYAFLTTGFSGAAMVVGTAGAPVSGGAGGSGGATSFGGAGLLAGGGSGGGANGPTTAPFSAASPNSAGTVGGYLGLPGTQGGAGMIVSGAVGLSGVGASSPLGSGGGAANGGNGGAGAGYGSGGAGGLSLFSSVARSGGAGAPGVIIIEEFA